MASGSGGSGGASGSGSGSALRTLVTGANSSGCDVSQSANPTSALASSILGRNLFGLKGAGEGAAGSAQERLGSYEHARAQAAAAMQAQQAQHAQTSTPSAFAAAMVAPPLASSAMMPGVVPPGADVSGELVSPELMSNIQFAITGGARGMDSIVQRSVPFTPAEAMQIRSRATVLARHIQTEQAVQQQVDRLASALQLPHPNITDATFPPPMASAMPPVAARQQPPPWAVAGGAPSAWASQFAAENKQANDWAAEFGGGGSQVATQRQRHPPPPQGWLNEFNNQQRAMQPHAPPPGAWAAEFAASRARAAGPMPAGGGSVSWADEFHSQAAATGEAWATEFQQEQQAQQAQQERSATETSSSAQQLEDVLRRDERFANSNFLNFVSRMSRGDVDVMEPGHENVGDQWASSFEQATKGKGVADDWASQFTVHQGPPRGLQEFGPPSAWAQEFDEHNVGGNAWADQFASNYTPPEFESAWTEATVAGGSALFERVWEDAGAEAALQNPGVDYEYTTDAASNPFTELGEGALAEGLQLFRNGLLREAVLALEAATRTDRYGKDAYTWNLLGSAHAENEDDVAAIQAKTAALRCADAGTDTALRDEITLALGVSHTNEYDHEQAMYYLLRWLRQRVPGLEMPEGVDALASNIPAELGMRPADRTPIGVLKSRAREAFERASQIQPDPDVFAALGVLCNLTRDHDAAVGAFRQSLALKPDDYSLWNKLGATLANGQRSEEAIAAYQKALETKPNYVRAWANLGISYSNVGKHVEACRCYARSLIMNPRAPNVWGYMRASAVKSESEPGGIPAEEVLSACDRGDIDAIVGWYPLD
ncbi:peroxisome biogenesis protein 5 [Pycnococcus provasolii]